MSDFFTPGFTPKTKAVRPYGCCNPPRVLSSAVNGLARPASAIGVGIGHTCALLDTGAVQCWGDNQSGQIGDGTVGGIRTAPKSVVGIP
jgi:alpha-tubulin suppressor-like RCC1 family protein